MSNALLLVPPFLKSVTGPLLGPALLAGAANGAGHSATVLDLSAAWLAGELGMALPPGAFLGDHDRPTELLRAAQREWSARLSGVLPAAPALLSEDPGLTLPYDHDVIAAAAEALADGPLGEWADALLRAEERPDLVGVSVLYSGQVLGGLLVTIRARRRWPGVPVVWGGAHITALREAIVEDARYGAQVDGFVFGYAERTLVELLDAIEAGGSWPAQVARAGEGRAPDAREDGTVIPLFERLDAYPGARRTLPAQASRGCAYGRCRFCTYPAVEGGYRALELAPAAAVVDHATRIGGAVSFKDSLVLPGRLRTIADLVGGRVPWSACTKLHPTFDAEFLGHLVASGCGTLEVGLETLTAGGQQLIDKFQSYDLFQRVLDAAANAGLPLVVNYMTGFPGVDPGDDARWLERVQFEIAGRPVLRAKLEHNTFQLERRSPMGRAPADYGVRVVGKWPWATVLAWQRTVARAARAA